MPIRKRNIGSKKRKNSITSRKHTPRGSGGLDQDGGISRRSSSVKEKLKRGFCTPQEKWVVRLDTLTIGCKKKAGTEKRGFEKTEKEEPFKNGRDKLLWLYKERRN